MSDNMSGLVPPLTEEEMAALPAPPAPTYPVQAGAKGVSPKMTVNVYPAKDVTFGPRAFVSVSINFRHYWLGVSVERSFPFESGRRWWLRLMLIWWHVCIAKG